MLGCSQLFVFFIFHSDIQLPVTTKKRAMQESRIRTIRWVEAAVGLLCLLVGCAIYVLFRSRSIKLYGWLSACGLKDAMELWRESVASCHLPEWVLFSLPDGLYCASYMLLMHALWYVSPRRPAYLIVVLIPLIAITHELCQLMGVLSGTFDYSDLLCYLLPLLLLAGIHSLQKSQLARA